MMERRGDLSAKQLITIIILIVSFAIIMLFYVALSPKSEGAKDICRSSVLLRGTAPLGKEAIQLNCKTIDVCISMGDGCKVSTEESVEVQTQDELLEEITDLMYDCWWQMGEGQIDYLPGTEFSGNNYCSICNRIHFGDDFKNSELANLNATDLFSYMRGRNVPGRDVNMLFAFYGVNSLESVRQRILDQSKVDIFNVKYNFSRGDNGYAIVTSMIKEGSGGMWTGVAVGAGVAALIIGWPASLTVGVVAGVVIVGAGAFGAVVGDEIQESLKEESTGGVGFIVEGPEGTDGYMPPSLMANELEFMKQLECTDFATLA